MSPSMRGGSSSLTGPGGCKAGKESTLVGLSRPRQFLFNVRMPSSSVSITAISASPLSTSAISAAALMARWITASAAGWSCQQSAATITSVVGMAVSVISSNMYAYPARFERACAVRCNGSPLFGALIGRNDPGHQLVANDVLTREPHLRDAFDAVEPPGGLGEAGGLAVRQVDLRGIAGDDHPAVLAEPGQEHLHLHGRGVLRLVQDDGCIGQGAAAHEGERCNLDLIGLQRALHRARIHQVIERVVDRPQIRIDLFLEVAGQEAEPLACLDRRTRQDDAVHFLALEQLRGVRHGEPGLAGAGGSDAEHHLVALQCTDVGILRGGTCAHCALAQIYALVRLLAVLGV